MSRFDADAMRRYEQARDEVVAQLSSVESLFETGARSTVHAARVRLERGKFVLAVVGEFSSGKSFLLNALLGRFRFEQTPAGERLVGLLATDINPTTATITELEYATSDEATAIFEDGRRERIPLDRLNRFVAVGSGGAGDLHDASKDERDAPSRVVVKTDSPFLQRGFVVADTPGLASINPAHRRATLGFLPSADAVLYLIDTQQPFSEGDAAFLGIVRRHIDSIFIVQTKIDLWQEPQGEGKSAWEYAHDRIASLAAVHAPGTYVYAVSARDYAEGILKNDAACVEASRFPQFLAALDASLIRRTGRARLRRALEQSEIAGKDALGQMDADRAMLALASSALEARRVEALPELDALDARVARERDAVLQDELARRKNIDEQGRSLADEAEQTLMQAFDTADIARLRDRARLHILVDRSLAHVAGEFAGRVAEASITELDNAIARCADIATLRFSLNDAAAHSFGSEPGTSLWSGDVRAAIAATIVLDAIGGPAIGLVHDIAPRFAKKQQGQYMKRELTADLRAEIFPRLRVEMSAFAHGIAARIQHIYDEYAQALAAAALQARDSRMGSIERALAARAAGDSGQRASALDERSKSLEAALAQIRNTVAEFLAHEEEIAPADPGAYAVRRAHADPILDRALYDRGLRPQRWRVAVLGPLRRGKSSLINAFAGRPVLTDEIAGSATFPIHVRYGDRDQALALGEDGAWTEIPIEKTVEASASSPVLRLTPWKHPRELVLVHAPAFDSGEAHAEDVNMVVASKSSAVLCLFSRQLSDRELALYERVAEFGRPMLFAHTIADNESAAERRNVVDLAAQYLAERNIPVPRIFTVSSHEYMEAVRAGRAPAGWNELSALISTIEGQAEAHMARLTRLERTANDTARTVAPAASSAAPGLLARLFGRRK
jgi:tRNA U34 5-carboxymethylaminomethyl modifying GTPase MnmE/TrmE